MTNRMGSRLTRFIHPLSTMPNVILASSSAYRRAMLKLYLPDLYTSDEASFAVPDVDEKAIRDEDPAAMAAMIAKAKMAAATSKVSSSDAVVITADQVVLVGGQVREKPVDAAEAEAFLRSYSDGAEAECINAIVVKHLGTGAAVEEVERSWVSFNPIPEGVLTAFAASPTALTTAGGFSAASDVALSKCVRQIKGGSGVSSVEGFPVKKIVEMLNTVGLECRLPVLGRVRCVIFDMDGLLLDTETFYTVAQQKILSRFDLEFSYEVKAVRVFED